MTELTFDKLPEAVAGLYHRLNHIEQLLQEQSHFLKTDEDKLLTIQEAVNFLNLSVPTLYGKAQAQSIW